MLFAALRNLTEADSAAQPCACASPNCYVIDLLNETFRFHVDLQILG